MTKEQEELLDSIDRAYSNGFNDGYTKCQNDKNKDSLGLYAMMLGNLKMQYQILSCMVNADNEHLKSWKSYIDNMDKVLSTEFSKMGIER